MQDRRTGTNENRQVNTGRNDNRLTMKRTFLPLCAAVLAATLGSPAFPQSGAFAPAIIVNGEQITGWELEQRKLFLQLIRAPGDIDTQARKALIEDRLRLVAAKQLGIGITADQVRAGMEEFASRANLTADQFVEAIGQGGVQPETFRDFVSAGLIWREVVRAKFINRVRVSEADIDRALSIEAKRGAGPRVLLSEIILPASSGEGGRIQAKAQEIADGIRSEADFAAAARANSAAASRDNGGRLDWIPLTNLPQQAQQVVAGLGRGQVSPPVVVPGGIALFQLRGSDQGGDIAPSNVTVDYMRISLPAAEAAKVQATATQCEDLYPVARKLSGDSLLRETRSLPQVPGDIAATLATLDAGEMAVVAQQGGGVVLVMLCDRTATAMTDTAGLLLPGTAGIDGAPRIREGLGFGPGPSRDAVRQELLNQRLNGLSDGYLAELYANAIINEAP